jgi:dephospho-CoA kinase
MFVVGLTGGVGSGKSTAADMFAELGAGIVDTDRISHELTAPGGAAIPALRDAFGADYIAANGALDRGKMRSLVFGDPAARRKLEAILHPAIRAEVRARIAAAGEPYVIVVVPLLLETGAYGDITNRILVVDLAEEEQLRRTAQRSGVTEAHVRGIMKAQLTRDERRARADDVLANNGSIAELRQQVERLHARYLEAARAATATGGGPA